MPPPITLAGVSYTYEKGDRPVLRDVDLAIAEGEIVLLTGPSGSGKTTLLTLVGALRALQSGTCTVLGQQLMGATESQRVALRRRIGFIFQQHNLLGFLTARQNVAMALELEPGTTEQGRLARAGEMLEAVTDYECQVCSDVQYVIWSNEEAKTVGRLDRDELQARITDGKQQADEERETEEFHSRASNFI